jgi:hypothetical protein
MSIVAFIFALVLFIPTAVLVWEGLAHFLPKIRERKWVFLALYAVVLLLNIYLIALGYQLISEGGLD